MTLALGIDTGGTCTDAVLLEDGARVVASAKADTTHGQLIDGLLAATERVLDGIDVNRITLVSLSTTLATNALVEGRGRPVGLVLIGTPAERLSRARLGEALGSDPTLFVAGGHRADGSEVEPLDLAALARQADALDDRVDAWAVSSMFSVRNGAHERDAARVLHALGGKPVSEGRGFSAALDAPRRALTALLNARLVPPIVELIEASEAMLRRLGIHAPLMVVKGDGTLMAAEHARRRPVETILSGPAASVTGAAWLAALEDCVVVDIGGTTTDVARIAGGRPAIAPDGARVGGWPTRVEAIAVSSVGLGGDSVVDVAEAAAAITLGPRRIRSLASLSLRSIDILPMLEAQRARGWPKSDDARFARALPSAAPARTSAARQGLLDRLANGALSLERLMAGGGDRLALDRLVVEGRIELAGLTPTDACHVLGEQSHGDARASWLGARLTLRAVGGDGDDDAAVRRLCERVRDELSRASAVTVARVLLGVDTDRDAPTDRVSDVRAAWLDTLIGAPSETAALSLVPRLHLPWVGLGASAEHVHPGAAHALGGTLVLPEHRSVANAIGAVVGVVREQRHVVIQPVDRRRMRVLLPEGPVERDDLGSALALAETVAHRSADEAARRAGAGAPTVSLTQEDRTVEMDGERVLLECVVTATATGRPRQAE